MAFLPVIETITTNPELHGFKKQSKTITDYIAVLEQRFWYALLL